MKKIVCILCILAALSSCGGKKSEIKNSINELSEAMRNKDEEKINEIIFLENDEFVIENARKKLEEAGVSISSEEKKNETGILSEIFSQDKIEIKKIGKDTIECEITGPDISNIFQGKKDWLYTITEEELNAYLQDFIDSADSRTTTVILHYIVENKKVQIDYKNREFFDAISGGFLTAYQTEYQNWIEESLAGIE